MVLGRSVECCRKWLCAILVVRQRPSGERYVHVEAEITAGRAQRRATPRRGARGNLSGQRSDRGRSRRTAPYAGGQAEGKGGSGKTAGAAQYTAEAPLSGNRAGAYACA